MEASIFVFRTSEAIEWHYKEMKEYLLRLPLFGSKPSIICNSKSLEGLHRSTDT